MTTVSYAKGREGDSISSPMIPPPLYRVYALKDNERESIEEIHKELKELDHGDANCVKESPVMAKLRKLIEHMSDTETKIGKAIKTVRQGVTTVQKLAKHYNDIAQWCGLPQVPKPFLGGEES